MRKLILVPFLALLATPASDVVAQQPGNVPATAQVPVGDSVMIADTIPTDDNSARNAFARALVLPGWGHFAIGANRRGAVFAALQGSSWFMLIKTVSKLGTAQDRLEGFEGFARDSLNQLMAADTAAARRLSDEDVFADAVAANPLVVGGQNLVDSRKEQRQDWITYTLFFTMASAVDAYVAANLKDFPVQVTTQPRRDGAVSFRFAVPVGGTGR